MRITERDLQPEIMDGSGLDEHAHRDALAGLARLNAISFTARAIWRPIRALAVESGEPIRVLDIATGSGDVPLSIAKKARAEKIELHVAGCDVSPFAVQRASDRARKEHAKAEFFVSDILNERMPRCFDVLTCSLFFHHLTTEQAIHLLLRMAAAAKRMVIVSDLRRGVGGYVLASAACRLVTRSPVVHRDGPQSVRNAFTIEEFRKLAEAAGIGAFRLAKQFPQRFLFQCMTSKP